MIVSEEEMTKKKKSIVLIWILNIDCSYKKDERDHIWIQKDPPRFPSLSVKKRKISIRATLFFSTEWTVDEISNYKDMDFNYQTTQGTYTKWIQTIHEREREGDRSGYFGGYKMATTILRWNSDRLLGPFGSHRFRRFENSGDG